MIALIVPAPEFDVFLSHATADKPVVRRLAEILVQRGLKPWLDDWNLVPGEPWQEAIEDALGRCAACAVFFGPGAAGPWQNEEMRAAIERQAGAGSYPVIPVLLPNAVRGERSRLPAFLFRRTWVELHDPIDDEHALRRLIAGIRGVAPGPDPDPVAATGAAKASAAVAGDVCPYRGLQFFDVGDAALFHGREAAIEWLRAKLQPAQAGLRFLAITGPSGSGKSSLARAGLLASLRNGDLPGSKDWPVAIFKPGAKPLENLAFELGKAFGTPPSTFLRDLGSDHRTLHINMRFALRDAPPDRRLVILADQFEEVFTLCGDEAQRQLLIGNLLYAAKEPDGQTAVVLTLRSDFYGRCAADSELAAAVSDRGELVGPMTEDELRSAIEEPARTAGLKLDDGLADLLVGEALGQVGGLPLLEHALLQLWQRRTGTRLTLAAYREIGGVAGALQQHAEEVFTRFTAPEQEACRRVLLRLVQVDEQGRATKRRLDRDELISAADLEADRKAAEAVVSRLSDERLLTAEAAGEKKLPTVELAHEALLTAWKRLQDWIDADREALRTRRRLDEAAAEWVAGGRDSSFLYIGARLAQAEEWAAKHPGESSGSARDFLKASVAQRDQKRRRGMISLATAALGALIIAGTMFWLWRESKRQQQINLATQMAGQARLALASNPLTSLLLATKSVRLKSDLPSAQGALLGALALSDAQPFGKPGIVAIAASSNRGSLATASQDGTVAVWNLASGPPKSPERALRVTGTVTALALSNDRRWLLLRNRDGNVRLLDLEKGDQETLLPDEDWRYGNPFSPDSRQLMTDRLGTPVLRNLDDHSVKDMPVDSNPNPWNSPDVNPKALGAPKDATNAVLSSDGRWLAWADPSGTVRLRDQVLPGLPALVLPGQGQTIRFLLFAPGDRWFVTQGGAEAPRLWDLQQYPSGGILTVTQDGSRLATSQPGATVRVEGPRGANPMALQGVEPSASFWAFSPDGSFLAAAGQGTLLLWNLASGNRNPRILPAQGNITAMTFSAKADRLALGGEGFATLSWDLGKGDFKNLINDKQTVTALAFNSSSSRLAMGWSGGKVRVFRLDEPNWPLDEAPALDAAVTALAFSPNGEWLAMADGHGKARLWKDGPGKPLDNRDPKVRVLTFSPDEHWLAGGGEEGQVQLWDLNSSGVPIAWKGHDGPVLSLSFTKTGKELITTGRSVRRWPLEVGKMIRLACEKAGSGRNLTAEEWKRNAPQGEKFRAGAPCGVAGH